MYLARHRPEWPCQVRWRRSGAANTHPEYPRELNPRGAGVRSGWTHGRRRLNDMFDIARWLAHDFLPRFRILDSWYSLCGRLRVAMGAASRWAHHHGAARRPPVGRRATHKCARGQYGYATCDTSRTRCDRRVPLAIVVVGVVIVTFLIIIGRPRELRLTQRGRAPMAPLTARRLAHDPPSLRPTG